MKRLFFFALSLIGQAFSYGVPPPPPPPCNTPQCSSGTYCYSNTNLCTNCPPGYMYNANPNVGVSSANLWGCTICPPGTFSTSSGSASCTPCSIGMFTSSSGSTSCNACPGGAFTSAQGQSGCSTCSPCSSGQYIATACNAQSNTVCSACTGISNCLVTPTCSSSSNSQCSTCSSGYYLQSNTCVACTICSSGVQYEITACTSSTNRQCTNCLNACPIGSALVGSCSGTSNPSCLTCSPGTYKAVADGSACSVCTTTCLAGFQLQQICSNSINSICVACPSGYYKALTDGSACLPCTATCPEGFQLNQACSALVNPVCVACQIGYYKALSDGSVCLPCTSVCPVGFQLNQACSAVINPVCIACPSGYYKALTDGSGCLPCTASCEAGSQLNQACSTTANPLCLSCPISTYKILSDGSPCLSCNNNCGPGSYLNSLCTPINNPICIQCPVNTANPNSFSLYNSSCTPCPHGSVSAIGSATCVQCPLGSATFGNVNCTSCLPGTYADSIGSITCKSCPMNTANALNAATNISACIPCAPGYSALLGSPTCSPCPLGTYDNGLNVCVPCLAGTYNNLTGQIVCASCPAGTANINTNSHDISQCLACLAGSFALSGSAICSLCPPGSFINNIGSAFCTLCPPGTFISGNGSTTVQTCVPGYYSELYGTVDCSACKPGYFNPFTGSTSVLVCLPCPLGTYVSLAGSPLCINTSIGFYQDTVGQTSSLPCPMGTFNNQTGSSSVNACLNCLPGQYQPNNGSVSCLICPLGTYQNANGQTGCIACPTGTYNPVNGANNIQFCLLCPAGTYSAIIGANSSTTCLSSPLGTYTALPGSSNYNVCSPGFYQDISQQLNCSACPLGTYNSISSATHINLCLSAPPGFFVSFYGSPNPTSCPPGYWVNQFGSSNCIQCPPGTFTSAFGSTQCDPCPSGTFALGSGFTHCEPVGNLSITFNDITSGAIKLTVRTNFTATMPLSYTCSQTCVFSLNKQVFYIDNNTILNNLINNKIILVPIRLGIDTLSVVYTGAFKSTSPVSWTCIQLNDTATECSTIPLNSVITALTLIPERDTINPYADPAINFSQTLVINAPLIQEYTFSITGLESAVNYTFTLLITLINETYPLPHINLGTKETFSGQPTGPVLNLVKYFLGIDVVSQANLEQANLQVHWDPPLLLLQHGPIIGYQVEYIQEERTFITYGPTVENNITPAVKFTTFTNETTLILSQLVPDTSYTITVYPLTSNSLTSNPLKGPGNTIQLNTQVSAPPKPPVLVLVNRAETNITVSWVSLTNETGLITKVWIVAEPFIVNSSQVVLIPLNNSALPPLPFPHEGVKGSFSQYNVSNPCQDEIVGYTFRSLTTGVICGGICNTICEFGTPMLDPTTILPTNSQNLTNDNFFMEFNNSDGNVSTRLVPYLTMKKRFVINSTNGGLLGSGKIVLGDGKINPNSLLNNTILFPYLSYRIRFIVFTSEVLYAISDPLEIPPFPYPDSVNGTKAAYMGIIIALCVVIVMVCIITQLNIWLKRRYEKRVLAKKKYLEREIISYTNEEDFSTEYAVPMLPEKHSGLSNPTYWTGNSIYKTAPTTDYLDVTKPSHYDTVDNPVQYILPSNGNGNYFNPNKSVKVNNKREAIYNEEDLYKKEEKYFDVSIPNENIDLFEDKYITVYMDE